MLALEARLHRRKLTGIYRGRPTLHQRPPDAIGRRSMCRRLICVRGCRRRRFWCRKRGPRRLKGTVVRVARTRFLTCRDGILFADLTEGQCLGGGRGGGRCLVTGASTPRPGHALRSALPATLCFIHLGRSWQRKMETKKFLRLSRQDYGLFAAKICFKPAGGGAVCLPLSAVTRDGEWCDLISGAGPHGIGPANPRVGGVTPAGECRTVPGRGANKQGDSNCRESQQPQHSALAHYAGSIVIS